MIATVLLLGTIWPDLFRIAMGAMSRAVWRMLRRPEAVIDWWPPETPRAGPAVDRMDRRTAWLADLLYTYRADVRASSATARRAPSPSVFSAWPSSSRER